MTQEKFWGMREENLSKEQIESICDIISNHIPIGNTNWIRQILFSPHNNINWFYAARHFAYHHPELNDEILNIIYP